MTSLYLVESIFNKAVNGKEDFEKIVRGIREELDNQNASLIEVQVAKDFKRAFFIFEAEERNVINGYLRELGVPVTLIKPVRLVGTDLEDVKKQADKVNYLVEWNLPENLTMDAYLERKSKNSVHYAEVPEVTFSRTYVCEDMTKCLCFYDSPDENTVKKAREAVKAPIDTITELS